MASLRERNRRNAMRTTQRTALDLFEDRGFESVTVTQIASHANLAASTIYRHFQTKEAIILWDEHDEAIDAALGARLRNQRPFEAIRDALMESLATRYDEDLDFQLRRVKFIFATEALHAAAVEADFSARVELTSAVRRTLSRENKPSAAVIAGAALVAVDVAMDEWQRHDAKRTLTSCLERAFAALADIAALE